MKINKATAIAKRSDGWWAIEVPEIPGLFTQARRLDQAEGMVRDAAKMLDYDIDEVDIQPKLSDEDERMLKELLSARNEANKAQEKASRLTRQTINVFRKKGITVRDIAGMIGVTPQRVSNLS